MDDGLDYMLKDGNPIRAREWICHRIADRAGLPVVEHKPILSHSGTVLFGSRVVLNGGPGAANFNLLAGTLTPAEASTVFSSVYAIDLFLGNGDRHADNFVIENDGATPRIRVIDFSEATALIEPGSRTALPYPNTSTVNIARTLRQYYAFSAAAACLALDRLSAVASIEDIMDEMPDDWLPKDQRNDIADWWLSAARSAHLRMIRDGLSNGTLL